MKNDRMTTAWIGAYHSMYRQKLWGLSLLERTVRELDKLGFKEIIIAAGPNDNPLQYFYHPIPKSITVKVEKLRAEHAFRSLTALLDRQEQAILALQGNTLHDKRVLASIIQKRNALVATTAPETAAAASVAILTKKQKHLFETTGEYDLQTHLKKLGRKGELPEFNFDEFDDYIPSMRRSLPPYLFDIQNLEALAVAEKYLKLSVNKGTNDLVAKYIHPPLEFGIVRFLVNTSITPNHITYLSIFISIGVLYLFITGQILAGIILAAIKCMMDGVDGKLARMLLKYSQFGSRLDHVGDAIFDGLWYLGLTWHFSQGDFTSTSGIFGLILISTYLIGKIVPGLFQKYTKVEIYEYAPIDKFLRMIGSRVNNNIWILLIGTLAGFSQQTFHIVCIYMAAYTCWLTFRFLQVCVFSSQKRTVSSSS